MEYGVILFDSISAQPRTGAGVAKACIEKNQRSLNTFWISGEMAARDFSLQTVI